MDLNNIDVTIDEGQSKGLISPTQCGENFMHIQAKVEICKMRLE